MFSSTLRRSAPVLMLALLAASAHAQPYEHVASTPHLSPEQEKAKFHLPPGFESQLVAAEPDIQKPMNMAFDAKGRLWLTDTVEYPYPVADGFADRLSSSLDSPRTSRTMKP